ncbi:two-component system CheB/CheR fusion protein [Flavobacterium chryseum]|uniref:CheR family methyltransferase n=1 Tax=Flavobacterium sp. P3160 TaxID=2512113 RepID=UPI00105DFD85|nr:CheR family methyltransferase [Flavobacterium sp. P3160]TDO73145.1 two-component system CheB/CheR fusion protein [Flavobacterium sp. P3160]
METAEHQKNQIIIPSFPVVGIVTEASEIDVVKQILSGIPSDSGMAIIVMENLDANQHADLTQQLATHVGMPVLEIVNTVELLPDHVYVIPEKNFLILENGILKLKPVIRGSRINNCLDIFYNALAQKYESYTIGLLACWSPIDGAAGLKNIREHGGAAVSAVTKIGFEYNKANAEFIDFFTDPKETAIKLLEIRESYLVNRAYEEKEISAEEHAFFEQIVELIVLKSGTNFHHYKEQTLRRRIAKRMVITKQESIERYLNLLKNKSAEQDLLFNDLLIPVTYFFRDQLFFDSLPKVVFPSLVESMTGKELRIWSAGCSTGEEAYSLAICLDEYLEQTNNSDITIKIFASDLSEKCIDKARLGVYTHQDLKNISEERLAKYFNKKESGYHVSKLIRDLCVFAVHDLTKDFPFSKIDFVACRNVLIYFDTDLQNHVLSSFHYALKEHGFLFLGKSESAVRAEELFATVERQGKIYRRKNSDVRFSKDMSGFTANKPIKHIEELATTVTNYKKIAADTLLEQYSPAAVVVNEDFEIVHFHGDTSAFLQPSAGKPSFNIINMVPHEIRFALRNAILKVRNEKRNVVGEPIVVKNQAFLTSFEVVYLAANLDLLLIIFCRKTISGAKTAHTSNIQSGKETESQLFQLQHDFKHLTEEQQIYFEELRSTNEELLQRTEELQYINEELETSIEELLSNNEELSCTNDELQNHRRQLASMRNFYESIVKTIHEPLLIIDHNFIVHSANPAFYNYFNTREELTEGILIFEIGNSTWNTSEFKESVLKKISKEQPVENVKIQFSAALSVKKVMLINAAPITDSMPEGLILIALEDITDLEQSNEALQIKNEELINRSRQLESFTAVAGEHLLDPVRKMYMFGKKIIDDEPELSAPAKHNVKRLLHSAVNMSQLIEDLVTYSKINFAEKKFKKTDLNVLVKKALNDLKKVISEHNAVISVDPLPPMKIIASQFHMLFTNLISNALKFAQHDTVPQIKISLHHPDQEEFNSLGADPETDYMILSVSDNGIGFKKDFENLIFDPFFRLQSNDQHYGSGLGLTLVQTIVSNHNGFVKASSEPGKGTTLYLCLPLDKSLAETYGQD